MARVLDDKKLGFEKAEKSFLQTIFFSSQIREVLFFELFQNKVSCLSLRNIKVPQRFYVKILLSKMRNFI